MLLSNKYAVISGAATENGIGYATARLFAEHGATVALLDLERNAPQKKAAILGENHRGYACDVTRKEACQNRLKCASRAPFSTAMASA
jgi:NAD(P)-dependent dehydrogenase (short-subunit alcohol dehydrogenase family)